MFKYSAPSTQPVVAPEFHGIPEPAEELGEKAPDRPGLSLVRTPSASPPRLRNIDADDDGDLVIPDILRKPADGETDQRLEDVLRKPGAGRFGWVPVATASAAGLVLVLAGGLVFYAAGSATRKDAGTVPVKTVSIDGQPLAVSPGTGGSHPGAPIGARGLDEAGFELRFNSAKAADRHPGSLKAKSQDRIAQILPKMAGEARARSQMPVLGYASTPNPHPGREEGLRAIASAAGTAPAKEARIANETSGRAAGSTTAANPAQPGPTPVTAAPAEKATGPGQTTDTSTVTADVNLRGAAEKDAPVLTVVPNGSSVGVGSCDRWWCAVEFDGRSGFVGRKFVAGRG